MSENKTFLVTGGSGYAASWIVQQLLEQGHSVRCTVRDKSKTGKYQHLLDVADKSPGTLEVFSADLLREGSFDAACAGADVVLHTASPFMIGKIKDPQKQLIDPALKGTRNVLTSVNKTDSVKRVVLTSSVVSIYCDSKELSETPNGEFTEEMWNGNASLKYQPYSYSKTLAEKEAWKMAEAQDRWDLVVINPSFILGPSLTPRKDSASINFMLSLLNGTYKSGVPDLHFGIVDVRNIAEAHVLAATRPEANGRYIVSNTSKSMLGIADSIRAAYGNKYAKLPKRKLPKFLMYLFGPLQGFSWKYVGRNVGWPIKFNNSRSKDLGVQYLALEQTLKDHVEQIEAGGFLKD